MTYTFDTYELTSLVEKVAERVATRIMAGQHPDKDRISQRQAYKTYGWANVREWERQGKITPTRAGAAKNSKRIYSRAELDLCLNSEDIARIEYRNKKHNNNQFQIQKQ